MPATNAPAAPSVQRTFRITLDIETAINPVAAASACGGAAAADNHQRAFVERLLARPRILEQLLRSAAVDELKVAARLFEAEYGWGRVADQQLLAPIIDQLTPAAQEYFTEELEDSMTSYHFDGYSAAVKHYQLILLDPDQG
jgi:hypothetical protein